MLLEASAALAPFASFKATAAPPGGNLLLRRPVFPAPLFGSLIGTRRRSSSLAATESGQALTGLLFQPFEEIKEELSLLPTHLDLSLARQKYADECESALNQQINVEYNNSYVYHALFAYFDRDNVALKGLAKFFKESSEEEREHAEKLMEYQNKRGGRVKLQSIVMPLSEFDHPEKGDALHAMELTLALEKLTNEKLLQLLSVAEKCNDAQLADFIESEFLEEQVTLLVEAIKRISEYVAQLRRVGKGHGVWHFDQMLLREGDAAAA
ncbi:ferritin-4, chloroplastic-like isoform X1 [Zingiber officinale]|uniref:ferritin-4, chloroplastic-like isoform X1 n=1 Tax=Zingiber officinale TaxID=94328 RepID=UPI001C4BB080|nr:ferritin-4, chloroplastic-like isoform X1 [Zingiber officinale]